MYTYLFVLLPLASFTNLTWSLERKKEESVRIELTWLSPGIEVSRESEVLINQRNLLLFSRDATALESIA